MSEVLPSLDPEVFYLPGAKAIVHLAPEPVAPPTKVIRDDMILAGSEYAPWGTDNLLPNAIRKEINVNHVLPSIIKWKVDRLVSGGIMYGERVYDKDQVILQPMHVPEIDDFLEQTMIDTYLEKAAVDHFELGFRQTEFRLSLNRKVAKITAADTQFCRLGLQIQSGRRRGEIDKVYYNANWDTRYGIEDAIPLAAIDPDEPIADQIAQRKEFKLILPSRLNHRGNVFYPIGPVEPLIDSKWLAISKSIPLWKSQVMENQLTIKYIIKVNKKWWSHKYPDWDKKSESDKRKFQGKEMEAFSNLFKGKPGSSLFSPFEYDNTTGKEYSDWIIEPLKNWEFGDKIYMEETTVSDQIIARSQGVDLALVGMTPGNGMGSGSGSDKRVAGNLFVINSLSDQRKLVEPLKIATTVNGWHKYGKKTGRLDWWMHNYFVATLEHGREIKSDNRSSGSDKPKEGGKDA